MSGDAQLVIDLWELFKTHIPEKKRSEAVLTFVMILEEHGIYCDELHDCHGVDSLLDTAIDEIFGTEQDDEEEDCEYGED